MPNSLGRDLVRGLLFSPELVPSTRSSQLDLDRGWQKDSETAALVFSAPDWLAQTIDDPSIFTDLGPVWGPLFVQGAPSTGSCSSLEPPHLHLQIVIVESEPCDFSGRPRRERGNSQPFSSKLY